MQAPLGYVHGLIQAARRGTLDRSALLQATPKSTSAIELKGRLHELAANSRGLNELFKHAGIPLEENSALKRTTWVQEFERLRQALNITT